MTERLAADQHGGLVQLLACFVFPAGIYLTLVSSACPPMYAIIRNILYWPRMGFVYRCCIFCPVPVNVGIGVHILPNLFFCRCLPDPPYNLPCKLANNRAKTLPAAFSVSYMGKIFF